ncbi:MAG: hypothetical protein ABIA47_04745 [bacterium]
MKSILHVSIVLFVAAVLVGAGCRSQESDGGESTGHLEPSEESAVEYEIQEPETDDQIVVTEGHIDETVEEDGVTINIESDYVETVNCGSEDCFDEKLAACEPAVFFADMGFVAVQYEIIGPVSGGCSVTFSYPTNPNPEWENQPMTCVFDNSLPFEQAAQAAINADFGGGTPCVGPLHDVIHN